MQSFAQSPPSFPPDLAMVPKRAGKPTSLATEEKKAAKAARRRANVVFLPALTEDNLMEKYSYVYARKTKDHEATVVLPGSLPPASDQYHFFTGYFYCGLCPPFSDFFVEVIVRIRALATQRFEHWGHSRAYQSKSDHGEAMSRAH